MSELLDQFDRIATLPGQPGTVELFAGIPLSTSGSRHLARDGMGRPAILFRVAPDPHDRRLVSISLENLHVEHGMTCRIATDRERFSTGQYSIIRCVSTDRRLQEYFLNTLDGIVRAAPDPIAARDVANIVEALVTLFHALCQPSTRSVMGLWAELFLIRESADPRLLIQAWHSEAVERYDFSWENQRIEVKASSDRSRRHHFSLEQAYPPEPLTVLVASMHVEPCVRGTSLGGLWDQLRTIASGDLDSVLKIERICMEAIGSGWEAAASRAYDAALATESLAFYDIETIPKVPFAQSAGVDEIRFRSDLAIGVPVARAEYRQSGELFDAVLVV